MPRPEWSHKLKHNAREWSPKRCIFFDTETGSDADESGVTLPLRSWEACALWRDKPVGSKRRERWFTGRTGLELAHMLDQVVTSEHATWIFAHNLGFDLTTTRLPLHLVRLGWKWTMGTITSDSPWLGFAKGNRTFRLVDSYSHLQGSLKYIGELMQFPKLTMPAFDAPDSEWETYRHRDVELLRDAVLQYLDWWDSERLGNLSVSGAATGWNCWRHTADQLKVRIEADPEVRAFGRQCIYGGRRSAWRTGEQHGGPWVELDFRHAHLDLLRHELMPVSFHSWTSPVPLGHKALDSERVGLVSDCVVQTDTPRYPLLSDRGVLYPVGTFATRLCGPELRLARDRGELLGIRRGLAVGLGRPMKAWADWVADLLDNDASGAPVMARLAAKGWSRSCVGKWAARSSREVLRYPWRHDGWTVETGFYGRPDVPCTTVYMEGEARVSIRDQESDNSQPFAYAWITSQMRVLLGRLLDLVGTEHLVSCNTDSVVVDVAALRPLSACPDGEVDDVIRSAVATIERHLAPYHLSVKVVAGKLRIRTPEHLVMETPDGEVRKVASVPRNATAVDTWEFVGELWPGIAKQLTLSQGEQFRLERKQIDISGARPLAWLHDDGTCEPPRFTVAADGTNHLQPPSDAVKVGSNRKAERRQHPALRTMLSAERALATV